MIKNDDIFSLFGIMNDDTLLIDEIETINNTKVIHISKKLISTFCPCCNSRMHSKGIYVRKIKHQVLQDSTKLYLYVKQRTWICPVCKHRIQDSFPFLKRYSQSSNIIPYLVLDELADLNRTTASVAKQFNLSDTQVHNIFTSYVDMQRLPLPEIISVDEVYLNTSKKDLYAFVIMDFVSGEIIDILPNRLSRTLDKYFYSIPHDERKKVKYIISDAYKTYLNFTKNYFPNAISIVDGFHITKSLIQMLNDYIYKTIKKFREKDKKRLAQLNHDTNSDHKQIKESTEIYMLRNYKWILLKNQDDINYTHNLHYDRTLKMYLDTYQIERMFLEIDKNFPMLRQLKEEYIAFSHTSFDNEDEVKDKLNNLIKMYEASDQYIFHNFAAILKEHSDAIINSFIIIEVKRKTTKDHEKHLARLSNGPMESFNRKPKDYKRNSRGSSNFYYTRNRILFATRSRKVVLAVPKPHEAVHSFSGKKRGSYNKKNK